jgi:hypothetical protein
VSFISYPHFGIPDDAGAKIPSAEIFRTLRQEVREYLAGRACPVRLTNHRKRVLRGDEQSSLRSVHSKSESLAIEPRNKVYRRSFRRGVSGNNIDVLYGLKR